MCDKSSAVSCILHPALRVQAHTVLLNDSGLNCSEIYHSGDKGIRTLDPLLARQVLSQLSYTPINPAITCSPMPSPA